jgi:PAS domain S-box-containing protein
VLESFVEGCADGIVGIDRAGTIVLFNRAAGEIFGVDPAAMIGSQMERLFVPDMFVEHQRYVRDYFEGRGRGVMGTTLETEGWHREGRRVPIEISLTLAGEAEGALVFASIRNIAGRRAVAQHTEALLSQIGHAQRLEALGLLAAGIAHDFNNVLGLVLGYASAIVAEVDREHRHHHDAAQIVSMVRHARKLTDDLLNYSRQGEVALEPLSLNRVARNVTGFLRRTLPKSIIIRTRLARGANVEGDYGQLEHCLMNLCLNARDAMPDGGELTIQTVRESLDAERAQRLGVAPGAWCRLSVADNGVGMAPETRDHALDFFFTTKPAGAGSGLGLALVRAAVQRHGGTVEIESELGKGTTVTLWLPATDAQPTRVPIPGVPFSAHGSGETILLVDDERHLREMAKRLFEGLGYTVLLAASGEEAVEIFREQRSGIALVVLDVMLGGALSGAETLTKLREVEPEVRVLVSSGYAPTGAPNQLLEQGVAGFIQKPYGIDEIGDAIRKALKR